MSSSSNQAENGHKYFFLLDFTFTFHAGTWYSPPLRTSGEYLMQKTVTYIQGSCSFSQMQNILPRFRGKKTRGNGRSGARGGGGEGRHKGLSYFLCHLLASTFTAVPLHHVKDCKQENNNRVPGSAVRERRTLSWRSPPRTGVGGGGVKNICFYCPFK